MNFDFTGKDGLFISVKKADNEMKVFLMNKVKESWDDELRSFLVDLESELRKLEHGETKTIVSKPIEVVISRTKDE